VSVPIKHLYEVEYSEWCGHMTDDVEGSTLRIDLRLNISKTGQDSR